MKRLIALLFSCLFLCAAALPAAAEDLSACEEEVVAALKAGMETVNGRVVLPSRDIAQFRRFFQNYEISEEGCAGIRESLENIRGILKSLDYKSYDDIPLERKEALRAQLLSAAGAMGAELQCNNGKFVFLRDGKPVFEESVKILVPVKPDERLGVSIAIVVLLVGGLAFSVIGSRKFETGK